MIDHITGNTTFKRIEVIVSPSGETKLTTIGFSGPSCQEASRELVAALGAVLSDQPTSELYATKQSMNSRQAQTTQEESC